MTERIGASSDIEFTLNVPSMKGVVPKDQEINVYRIVQESLNNIVKHSGATRASIDVATHGTDLGDHDCRQREGLRCEVRQAGDDRLGVRPRRRGRARRHAGRTPLDRVRAGSGDDGDDRAGRDDAARSMPDDDRSSPC